MKKLIVIGGMIVASLAAAPAVAQTYDDQVRRLEQLERRQKALESEMRQREIDREFEERQLRGRMEHDRQQQMMMDQYNYQHDRRNRQ